ncbi:MAG: hypothetical protein JSV92_04130, partial [archaeon]
VPRNQTEYGCTLHEIMGFDCNTCNGIKSFAFSNPPFVLANNCLYYDGKLWPEQNWCGINFNLGRRLCACV